MAQAIPLVTSGLSAIGGGSAATGAALAASTAATVGGTVASISEQRKAQRAQEKAAEVDRAQAEIANQRSIRRSILQSRAQQAQLQAQGVTSGIQDSSGFRGAVGSTQTQTAANVGFARQTSAAGRAVNELTSRASGAQGRAATFGAISQLPTQLGFGPGALFEQAVDNRNT